MGISAVRGVQQARNIGLFAQAPRAFVTSPSSAEKEALNASWPGVSQLLYPLDVVQAEWDWLSAARNEVGQEERLDLMAAFQKVRQPRHVRTHCSCHAESLWPLVVSR